MDRISRMCNRMVSFRGSPAVISDDGGDVARLVTHPLQTVPGLEDQRHETKIGGHRRLAGHDLVPAPFHIEVQVVDHLVVDHHFVREVGIPCQQSLDRVVYLTLGHLGHVQQQHLELVELGVELAADFSHPNRPVM